MRSNEPNALGLFLKERRRKIDPEPLGYPMTRRRTPGLRREEVALRANVSAAWYTWLEQGRGGTPSAHVLDRLARGLGLTEAEREHLFLLAQNRPPEVRVAETHALDASLQRLLDSLETSPAAIRSSAWDVLGANRAALAVLARGADPSRPYNILESFFAHVEGTEGADRVAHEAAVRFVVAQFRGEAFRGGYGPRAQEVVAGLLRTSARFREAWREQDVDVKGERVKTFELAGGAIRFESSTMSIDGHPGLRLVVFTPATADDRAKVRALLDAAPRSSAGG
jgi:transcriptional regulator with XRE-family HTH domain